MGGWQWFGATLLFLFTVGVLSWFTKDFKYVMRIMFTVTVLTVTGLGILALMMGTWVPW